MSRPHLKLAASPLSPERQVLADAIAEAASARAAADKARASAEAARGFLALAVAAVPAADRAAEAAKAQIIDNPHTSRTELRALRQAAADAVDDLAIAREVSERAEVALTAAERSARYATERVEAAADAVVASYFLVAIEAAERAARAAASLAFAAAEIGSAGDQWNGERKVLMNRAEALNENNAFGNDGAAAEAARYAAAAPWKAARATLMINPAAPVPEVP